tara:strand:- start:544 stop:654 length:111 start_codon:yes stop_codon:yes gene_type:complete
MAIAWQQHIYAERTISKFGNKLENYKNKNAKIYLKK